MGPRDSSTVERKTDGGARSERGGQWDGQRKNRSFRCARSEVGVGTSSLLPQEVAVFPRFNGFASCSYLKMSPSPPSLGAGQQAALEQKAEAPPHSSDCNGGERGRWNYRLIGH